MVSSSPILDEWGKSFPKVDRRKVEYDMLAERFVERMSNRLHAGYDGFATTPQNERYWAQADLLSPQSANSTEKRQRLRSRSRYECIESNSYARGMVITKANDVIGTGPTLQVQTDNANFNEQIEAEWHEWADETGFDEKLRVMDCALTVDGEAFGERITNRSLEHPVKLDLRLSEADLWTNQFIGGLDNPLEQDGILFDESGNPVRYRRLKYHPGDSHYRALAQGYDDLAPEDVIHWYRLDRPDQKRGIPHFTPALPLFAELRRWILATIAAAETAAEFAGIMQSTADRFQENADHIAAYVKMHIDRRQLMAIPAGWTVSQLKAEHPNAQFEAFEEKILAQIARCILMPLNMASGSSRNHNFASARLDYLLWWNACDIERNHCRQKVVRRVFNWWLDEARLVPDYLPPIGRRVKHKWVWPQRRPIDELQSAKAKEVLWNMGLLTDEMHFHDASIDSDKHYAQLERQTRRRAEIDEHFPQPGIKRTESIQDMIDSVNANLAQAG